jgi:succinyl-CoA synthetase beta subunit
MKIHEHQAKELLREYGVAVPRGKVAFSGAEAEAVAHELGAPIVVVKAQIHAGGRGKGGGIKLAKSPGEVRALAGQILGMTLVTPQTGPEGRVVRRLLIEEGCDIGRELYLGLVIDRESQRIVVMASSEGGMEIEEVAARSPEKILKEVVDPAVGLCGFQARRLGFALGLEGKTLHKFAALVMGVARAFADKDASLIEVNPLVITKGGDVLALDAKVNLDDNSDFRHPRRAELRDLNEEEPHEIEAKQHDLSYIKLSGTIGCLVNGAGLAMATMDIVKLHGAEPANFLDVGGGASKEKVTNAFKILLADANVRVVFVNIFGGIMRCDVIADGLIAACREVGIQVPLVVRLEGTNVAQGRKMLEDSKLGIHFVANMKEGAALAAKLSGGVR